METRIQLVAVLATAGMFAIIFELVRRRRLMERYALLWLFSSTVLFSLAVWKGLLEQLAIAIGIYYAPSALFAVAIACIAVLLLHFSLVISRLVDQSKVLAQQVGRLRERIEQLEARVDPASETSEHGAEADPAERVTSLH